MFFGMIFYICVIYCIKISKKLFKLILVNLYFSFFKKTKF